MTAPAISWPRSPMPSARAPSRAWPPRASGSRPTWPRLHARLSQGPRLADHHAAAEVAKAEAPFFTDIDPAVLTTTIATYQKLGNWTPHVEITRPAFEATARHLPARRPDHQAARLRGRDRAAAGVGSDAERRQCIATRYDPRSNDEGNHRLDRRRQHGPSHEPAPGRRPAIRWWSPMPSAPSARRRRHRSPRAMPRWPSRPTPSSCRCPTAASARRSQREIAAATPRRVKTVIDTSTIGIKAAEAVARLLGRGRHRVRRRAGLGRHRRRRQGDARHHAGLPAPTPTSASSR